MTPTNRAFFEEHQRRLLRNECQGSLLKFVRTFWPTVEPNTPLVEGWLLYAIIEHLEAVSDGRIRRLLINVMPGAMKSLLVNVFWPAWEWTFSPGERYVTFSYSAGLTERDNQRFLDVVSSPTYRWLWPRLKLRKKGETLVSNWNTGWKLATSIGGVGTGQRGNRCVLDDPHNVKEAESEPVRTETVRWFNEAMRNRLNDAEKSAIVVVMQRVHEDDVSGSILAQGLDYVHLCVPAEYESDRHCETAIGWSDPRTVDGELAWPERFSAKALAEFKKQPFVWAGQYQQRPEPRGGGIFKRDDWGLWSGLEAARHGVAVRPERLTEPGPFPPFEFILASLDTALGLKEENDWTALTIWGTWKDDAGLPRVMLIRSWRGRKELHGRAEPRKKGETWPQWYQRTNGGQEWGLVEWVAYFCHVCKVEHLLIEEKNNGYDVASEMRRLYAATGLSVQLVNPGNQDKVSRAYAVQHLFTDNIVWAPGYDDGSWPDYVDVVVEEMAKFPRSTHDDYVDSSVQALRWLRQAGFALRSEEHDAEMDDLKRYRKPPAPIYDV